MSLFDDAIAVFPNNAIELIATRLKNLYEPDLLIVKRPLKHTDNTQSVGIYGGEWFPDQSSFEFASKEPTVQVYLIKIQAFCKEIDEPRGIAVHSVMAKVMRSLLYNDVPLAVGLNALSVTMNGATERIQRRGINRQQYLNNEIGGQFLYLSTLEYYIETETK
jgi:hypothetical protein